MEPRPKIKLPIPYEPPRKDLNQLKTLKKIDTKLESLNNDIMKFIKKDELGLPIFNKIKYFSKYERSESDVEVMMNCIYELLKQIDFKRSLDLESKITSEFTLDGKSVNYLNILESLKNNENYEDGIDRNMFFYNVNVVENNKYLYVCVPIENCLSNLIIASMSNLFACLIMHHQCLFVLCLN